MKWSLYALLLGSFLDLLIGDPHGFPHPVIAIGKLISVLERFFRRLCPKNTRGEILAGGLIWFFTAAISTAVPVLLLFAAQRISVYLRLALESVMCWQILAAKSLQGESMKVYAALKTATLPDAQKAVSMIVGRDTERLDEPGVARAAVETVAENTSDGVIAPLFYLALGGAGLGFFYKAVNTMDSMLGYVEPDRPAKVSLYAATFADKDAIGDCIARYNDAVSEDEQLTYTDYVALLMRSITTIVNAISYVLIAFVAISLVVSSIMIGIITYISVLERTKEIGILRSIGASKQDISRVFNAETLIEGFTAGVMGILCTLILLIPINLIVHHLTGLPTLSAILPVLGAILLILISMALTFIAGLIPSGMAAKKDPVVALRTE